MRSLRARQRNAFLVLPLKILPFIIGWIYHSYLVLTMKILSEFELYEFDAWCISGIWPSDVDNSFWNNPCICKEGNSFEWEGKGMLGLHRFALTGLLWSQMFSCNIALIWFLFQAWIIGGLMWSIYDRNSLFISPLDPDS